MRFKATMVLGSSREREIILKDIFGTSKTYASGNWDKWFSRLVLTLY